MSATDCYVPGNFSLRFAFCGVGIETMDRSEIISHATHIRRRLEKISAAKLEPFDDILGDFPDCFCLNSARLICRYFHYVLGIDEREIRLCANAYRVTDNPEERASHGWCRIGEFHVDITADQFEGKYPEVVVEKEHPMVGDYSNPDLSDYEDSQKMNSEWRAKFYDPIFAEICSSAPLATLRGTPSPDVPIERTSSDRASGA